MRICHRCYKIFTFDVDVQGTRLRTRVDLEWSPGRWRVITDARSAPEAGRTGAYLTLGARLQVEWP